ncbi:putative methyltransferase-domain-containing protein [Emericellopsis atlantica]|uniref:Methyltransferase-domain-containing protein n=1 Tax=Emericellopsis atlantica TaxID=2614577 RepID=A0A9P7ZQL0_9HYPO|nr:putative methyltransferase-domain-containing protein [Emericellopsis atlantica]KAG9256027.1 putative methyltransferase-domain-containing protein [Emericellopsis atlantica]
MDPIEVLDLPQVWQQPTYDALITTLESLELSPPIWKHTRRRSEILHEQESLASQRKGEVTRYLSSIIKSPLDWLADDDQRELVWSNASKRMTERCGRTAMGEVVRQWPFNENEEGSFKLVIREPALTGDSLGFKTWGSSYVLARHLPQLATSSLSKLFEGASRERVLELGSGTGLLGTAAAAFWGAPVILSDLPNIVPNLRANAESNTSVVTGRGGSLTVGPLTWGGSGHEEVDQDLFGEPGQFKIVLVADPLYDDDHPRLLASAVATHLSLDSEARAAIMVPQRDETTKRLAATLRHELSKVEGGPVACIEEDILAGQDDWGNDDDGGAVDCWLGIFARSSPGSVV